MNKEKSIVSEKKNDLPLDLLVRAEKLQLLYQQSFPAIFASLLTAVLLCAILWSVQEKAVLIGWLSALAAASLVRFLMFVLYWRMQPQGKNILAWEKPYFLTLLLSSLIWGFGSVLILPLDSAVHQAVVYYFVIGMSGGAVAVYSAHRIMILAALGSILLPITVWFFLRDDFLSVGMALGAVVFMITVIRGGKILSMTLHQSFQLSHELNSAKEIAEKLAVMDELTGLNNRRAFYEDGEMLANHCQRKGERLSMIVMDIDYFKKINDTLGHAAGDATLTHIGKTLRQTLRESDICARIGGEEFGMLFRSSTSDEASQLAEKLRQVIAETPVLFDDKKLSITASFGVATGDYSLEALFKCADAALYQAKEMGRDQVICGECMAEKC